MVSHFIAFLYDTGYKPSTIASYISAISFIHKLNSWSDPTNNFLVKKILKGTQNLSKTIDARLPITKDILKRLVNAVECVIIGKYNKVLLRAMMTLAYFCFLRIGEMAIKCENDISKVIQMEDVHIEKIDEVNINMSVIIKNYKHSDLQPKTLSLTFLKNSPVCPVNSFLEYKRLIKHNTGPLFKFSCGTPVKASYFNSSLKKLLEFINLNPQFYKGHSFRIGAATSAAMRGIPLSVIQHMGRWKSNAFQHYIRLDNF